MRAWPSRLFAAFACLISVCGGTAFACNGTGDPRILSVGVQHFPPFIIIEDDAPPSGLNVDLWNDVSAALINENLISSSRLIECETTSDLISAVAEGRLDLAIAPITITSERLEVVDFAQQYFLSGLTVAALGDEGISFGRALETIGDVILRPGTGQALIFFLALNLLLAVLIRYLLWDARSDERGRGGLIRVLAPFLEAIERTLGLKGLNDSVATATGRMLEIFMALVGAALSAAIIGVLTTSFIAAIGDAEYVAPEDLPNLRVALIADTTSEDFYQSRFGEGVVSPQCTGLIAEAAAGCMHVDTIETAVGLVDRGLVDVALGDWAALSFQARQRRFSGQISVQPEVFRNEPLGWVLPIADAEPDALDRDAIRRTIDAVLVSEIRLPSWRDKVEAHLGIGAIAPD